MKLKNVLFTALLIALAVFIGTATSDAQTSRKKKKKTKTIAAVLPTPVPQAIPQIISRADEYPNQTVVTEAAQTDETENSDERTIQTNTNIDDLNARIKSLESKNKNDYDQKQKRLSLNLDILTKSESRAEMLRKQLFEMVEKQNAIQIRIDQINYDMQPAMIDRYAAFAGSLRPEEIRESRRKSLESEKTNLESLQAQITTNRTALEESVGRADALVLKLRTKLEKEIDDALNEDEEPNN
jgi:hypothetical protein